MQSRKLRIRVQVLVGPGSALFPSFANAFLPLLFRFHLSPILQKKFSFTEEVVILSLGIKRFSKVTRHKVDAGAIFIVESPLRAIT